MGAAESAINAMKTKARIEGNLEVHGSFAILAVNAKIFPLNSVYAASGKFLDQAYIMIDGDPKDEIVIELRKKGDLSLHQLGRELGNELITSLEEYLRNAAALKAQEDAGKQENAKQPTQTGSSDQSLSYKDDPLGIMKPWGEKS